MLEQSLLQKLDFDVEDIELILRSDKEYGSKIAPISDMFMNSPQEQRAGGELSAQLVQKAVESVPQCDNPHMPVLLFWLYCVPHAREYYQQNNISMDVFYDTMKDITCKVNECKQMHGKVGICSPWFYLHFSFVYFALGRLQYYVENYIHNTYSKCGFVINKGDRIYSCHIPSGSKLSIEKCLESFQLAYEFFKPELEGDIIPLICTSWLLYPPYIERVFPENSNITAFAKLFDMIGQNDTGQRYSECQHVFNTVYKGSTKDLPSDNTLRRNMIEYMNSGASSGSGIGIILYDGKKKQIL